MSNEINIHGGVVRVTDASVMRGSRFNRIKAINNHKNLSVHFTTDGVTAPGPREALLVTIISGIHQEWLESAVSSDERPVDINFSAVSAEVSQDKPYHLGQDNCAIKSTYARADEEEEVSDVLHMSTVERDHMTRLQFVMTNESGRALHAAVVLSKGQVTQMIAALLVLYSRLHED